ncbi:hypothetical protein C8N24_1593 [Solirubrobacter pauli]|uniref:Uncharacterized protein n=1 Tax=Solirubrobacter pauli TaxID=166793 RepID=A0A660LC05_9ACTN|nr:hypothetical protein [Solirubrobacter pauli]RKQ91765.1 hypothetical protein C8N24_1593 [Solirubrobacter pauli]
MTAIARPLRDRRRSAGPVAIALLLAVAGFVLALSIGAALQSGPEPVSPASAPSSANAVKGGSPAPDSVREISAGGVPETTAVKLSTVPALPTLHGVKARKAKKKATPRRTSPAPVVRSQPRVVAPAPTVAPRRSTPVAPYRPSTPQAPVKKNPGFVGKDFDSSG